MCRWRHKIRKIAVKILQSVNNRMQSLREIAYYALLLLTYIVINTLLGRVTQYPAGMHCPAGDDASVSSYNYCLFGSKNVCIELSYLIYKYNHIKSSYTYKKTWHVAFNKHQFVFLAVKSHYIDITGYLIMTMNYKTNVVVMPYF